MIQRISIYGKLLAFAAILLLFTAFIGVMEYTAQAVSKKSNAAYRLKILALEIEQNEVDFLVKRHISSVQSADSLSRLFESTLHADFDTESQQLLNAQLYKQRSIFNDIVTTMKQRGLDENSGFEGRFRNAVHAIEAIVDDAGLDNLKVFILQARRSEKDFLARSDDTYIYKVHDAIGTLQLLTKQSALPPERQREIHRLSVEYLTLFDSLTFKLKKSQRLEQDITTLSKELNATVFEIVRTTSQNAETVALWSKISVLVAIFVGIFVALWIAKRLSQPIQILDAAVGRVAAGDVDFTVDIPPGDELGNLAASFNAMIHAVNTANRDLVEKAEEVRLANKVAELAELEVRLQNIHLQEINIQMDKHQQQLQQQAEELQASNASMEEQQQQLQQQTEELQVTNAHMEEQQQQLQLQTEELQATNAHMEEQQQQLELTNRELLRSKREINAKATQIEQASRYKSEFLANMSHELRTPLNSIILLSKMMSDNHDNRLGDEEVKRSAVIHRSGKELLNLINDVLDLSKIEAGRTEVHFTEICSDVIKDELHDMFTGSAEETGVDFIVEDSIDGKFISDKDKVGQILRNLLSNAFKFTKSGSVTLLFEQKPNHPLPIHISVRDTGIGIPTEKQEIIFEAFRQADGSTSREYGGTGLGLTISLRFAKLLGGTIVLNSIPGVGSEFCLQLPVNPAGTLAENTTGTTAESTPTQPENRGSESVSEAATPTPQPINSITVKSKRSSLKDDRSTVKSGDKIILLIDDDWDFSEAVLSINRSRGYKTIHAENAEKGLEAARAFHPAGIMLDLGLPDRDGADLLREIKASRDLAHIPVYVISARDRDEDSLSMNGIVGYLQKPVDSRQIAEAGASLMQAGGILVVSSGGITDNDIAHLLSNFPSPTASIRQVTAGDMIGYDLEETPLRLVIIDLAEMAITKACSIADEVKQLRPEPSILFFCLRPPDEEEEFHLRRYSDSIIVQSPQVGRRIMEDIESFLRTVHKSTAIPKSGDAPKSARKLLNDYSIMVVDDDTRNLFVITAALEQEGARVTNALNGRKALDLLENNQVDLIITDIMMPVMDGYETIKALKANPQWNSIPIIALTAKAMHEDRDKILAAGADDYFSKPVDYDVLINAVALLCARIR